jgi:hypothetical protein
VIGNGEKLSASPFKDTQHIQECLARFRARGQLPETRTGRRKHPVPEKWSSKALFCVKQTVSEVVDPMEKEPGRPWKVAEAL